MVVRQVSAGTGGRTIKSVELRLDAALAATPGVITSTQPTAAVQLSNANGGLIEMQLVEFTLPSAPLTSCQAD